MHVGMYIYFFTQIMMIVIGILLLSCVEYACSQPHTPLICVDVDFPDCRVFENKTAAANTSSIFVTDVVRLRNLYTQVNCSNFSYFFVCAASYPYCIAETETLRYPCRDMCERVKRECSMVSSLLDTLGIFNCETYSIGGRCITQDEALASIIRAGLLPPDATNSPFNNNDDDSSTKGLTTTWTTICFVSAILTILLY